LLLNTGQTNFVQRTANNPLAWLFYRACGRLANYLGKINAQAQFARQIANRDALRAKVTAELFPDLTVSNGPFKGLRYPSDQALGSALFPKLLGSYESELHPSLNALLNRRYDAVVDVGCGEGYYAVGLALRLPRAEVYAFDTEPRVRELCQRMAEFNGVANRLHIGGLCDQQLLRGIGLGQKALILSDCEGYEGSLFDSQMAAFLRRHDLIIETHDFIDIELSDKMRQAFAETHNVRSVKSTDDIERVHACDYPQLKHYTLREKYLVLSEWRPAIMEWLVMTSKDASPAS
jgi:SAM-dependent methyltransferase